MSLLGSPRVVCGGSPVTTFRTTKGLALLSYLAVTGSVQARPTLAGLFWPEADEKQASASLRMALSDLRKLLGAHLDITRQTVSLRREALWLDVAQFDALLKRTGDRETDVLQMQAAVALYSGEFLEGFYVPGAPQFEQWVTVERERLREAMLNALLALAQWHADERDFAASLEHLTRLLAIEPAREDGHRLKMAVLAEMGQRSAALQQYEACRSILAEELGVDPLPETMALHELIRAGQLGVEPSLLVAKAGLGQKSAPPEQRQTLRAASPPAASGSLSGLDRGDMPEHTAFHGREEDLALLHRWLTREGAGLVALTGMGGVGKTTLAAESVTGLPPASYDLIIWRSLVNAPPLATLLDAWLQALTSQHRDRLPDSLDEKLALLFAELQRRRCLLVLDNLETIMHAGARTGHFRPGYEGYGQLVDRMGRSLHQSCLLLTTRELPRGLQRLEEDYPRVRIMALAGLPPAAGTELLQARGVDAPGSLLQALVDRYSGNPLALKLVADTVRDLYGGDVDVFLRDEAPVFDDIGDVLDQQFDRLSDLEREIVTWLAVEREPASARVIWDDLAHPPRRRDFLEVMRSLQRNSLVEEGFQSSEGVPCLALQNVVMEYAADRLVHTVCQELESGQLVWLHRHALVKAHSREYVQETQRRLLLQPVAHWLVGRWGQAGAVQRLEDLLYHLRKANTGKASYAGANLLHLLLHLQADLAGLDFSQLAIWQADLRQASLVEVDFRGVDLAGSTFANVFGAILSAVVSPDGRYLAAGGTDGVIHIWSVADYQPTHTLNGHQHFVTALAFSDDSRFLASGGFDPEIRLWDVQTGDVERSLHRPHKPMQAWCISMQGDLMAVAGMDKSIHFWNWRRGESQHHLSVSSLIDLVAIKPGGRFLAGVGEGAKLNLWDIHTGELLHTRYTGMGRNLALAFDACGDLLATGGEDRQIQLWNTGDMSLRQVVTGHEDWILSLAFSPDGKHLASGSADRTARIWNIEDGSPERVLAGHEGWVRSVAYTPDGENLVTGGDDQTVRLWNARTGELRHYLQGYLRWVDFVAFSPDGEALVSSSFGGSVRLWDVHTGAPLHQLGDQQAATRALAFSHDSAWLACGSDDYVAQVWDTQTGALKRVFQEHRGPVRDIAFSPDDSYLLTGSYDGTVCIWNAVTGQLRQVIPDAYARILHAMTFHPSGELLAFASSDHTVKLLHLESGQIVGTLPLADQAPSVVSFSRRGNLLACGTRNGAVWLWDAMASRIEDWRPLHQLHLLQESIWRLLFSPDDQLLVFNSEARDMPVVDVASGHTRYVVPNYYGAFSVDFSKDGRHLISIGHDNDILIRDAATGEVCRSLPGHEAGVTSLTVSPDGATIASSSADGSVRLWDSQSGHCFRVLEPEKPYSGMNIAGVTGITQAQKETLLALGAVERSA